MKLATSLFLAMTIGQFKEMYMSELTNLLLGATSGVTTRSLFATENGGRSISTVVRFPFYNNITTSAFIGVNGLISFGEEVRLSPQDPGNSFPSERTSYVIAPFWSNNDIRRTGRVRYEVYDGSTTASMDVLNRISDVVVNRTGESFQGVWMLLVEWEDCHSHPHGQSSQPVNSYLQQANTYQAVAITDGLMYSYAIFIYECGGIQWGGEAVMGSIFARVGISIGGNVIFSHSLSGNDRVDTIDCLNGPTSRWVNLLYDISLIRPSITSGPLPHTMSTVSSAVLVESSQFRASSSLFVGSGTTTSTFDKKISQTTSSTTTTYVSPSPSLSPSYSPPQTGSDDHSKSTEPEPTRSGPATSIETIVLIVVVLPIATGVVVCFTVLVLFAKYQKKKMKIMAQDITEVKQNQDSLSTSLVLEETESKITL